MKLSETYNKINCCLAENIYNDYLKTRYGIHNCNLPENIDNIKILRKTFNYFYNSIFCTDLNINTSADKIVYGECNISHIIEAINSI